MTHELPFVTPVILSGSVLVDGEIMETSIRISNVRYSTLLLEQKHTNYYFMFRNSNESCIVHLTETQNNTLIVSLEPRPTQSKIVNEILADGLKFGLKLGLNGDFNPNLD